MQRRAGPMLYFENKWKHKLILYASTAQVFLVLLQNLVQRSTGQ